MRKGKLYPKHDQLTRKIDGLLLRIPRAGSLVSSIYLWKHKIFNSMFIGGCGMVLNFLLYEGIFRRILGFLWGGTFMAFVITTLLVFFWNYLWTKNWIFSIKSQLLSMNRKELELLRDRIEILLASKFDENGERVGWG